jgi:hypothetical protein
MKTNYQSIDNFKRWNEVVDYESDENTVILLGKRRKKIAEFGYGGFTSSDFESFKNKNKNL